MDEILYHINRVKSGDDASFEQLLAKYNALIISMAKKYSDMCATSPQYDDFLQLKSLNPLYKSEENHGCNVTLHPNHYIYNSILNYKEIYHMNNYFRITTYSPTENVSAIVDCYGKFEEVWQFSAYLVRKKFKIRAVSESDAFECGNIPKAQPDEERLLLRACQVGEPNIQGNRIEVNGKYYFTK